MDPTRVLIADDHPMFRDGLRSLLTSIPGFEISGEAESGEEAVACAAAEQPDVVLMDINMPEVNGIEATRRILNTSPHIAILMLTMLDDDDSVFSALRAGARGYILKGADQAEIIRAIHAVQGGEAIFGPAIAKRLMTYFAFESDSTPASPFPELTAREREVLTFIGEGLNNASIASRLFLSPKTVRNHVSNILSKLQVSDRVQAALRAREAGLGRNDP